jgi:hypothetical protein
MSKKALVLNVNILIGAVLGTRVRNLLIENAGAIKFFALGGANVEAKKYLPGLLKTVLFPVSLPWRCLT